MSKAFGARMSRNYEGIHVILFFKSKYAFAVYELPKIYQNYIS
jgi:hypothetical protein